MSEREKNSGKYEEVNPFPEKAGAGSSSDDDSDIIFWDPDDRKPPQGVLEEARPVSAASDLSRPIEDEPSPLAKRGDKISVRPREAGSGVEEMARDIDSLELPSEGGELSAAADDFLSVLDDNRLNLIDEVVDRSGREYSGIESLSVPDTDLHSEVSLIEEERLVESKPLWQDDDDFWINDAEGFDVPPHELLEYLKSGGEPKKEEATSPAPAEEAAPAVPAPPAEPEKPFPDRPYILNADSDVVRIDVAALIEPEAIKEEPAPAPVQTEPAVPEQKAVEEVEIPFIEIDLEDLKDLKKADSKPGPVERGDIRPGERKPPADAASAAGAERPARRERAPEKSRLPEGFSITHIDLSEAEKIAKEDIFILSEEDLIEELEQIDLVPVTEMNGEILSSAAPEEKVSRGGKGDYTWLIPEETAVTDEMKKQIESDIELPEALVVEEDVRDIRAKLKEYQTEAPEEEPLVDITDRVFLMEDESDVERFIAGIPEAKREEMKKLLTYLDGLFEKLPEDVVRKFADSEYFDLYVKIMNDLGG